MLSLGIARLLLSVQIYYYKGCDYYYTFICGVRNPCGPHESHLPSLIFKHSPNYRLTAKFPLDISRYDAGARSNYYDLSFRLSIAY